MTATTGVGRPAPRPRTSTPERPPVAVRALGWVLALGGGIGAAAAFTLAVEKVRILQDPGYEPSCSINPILSCGSVMTTAQAEAFGFPNPLIGVAAFPVVATIGVLVLAGVRPPRWIRLGLQAGATFGLVFIHWLIVQSLYRIGALCPYCMVVWVVTVMVFWYTTAYNLHRGHLPASPRVRRAAVGYHTAGPVLWAVIVVALIGQRFWDYWRTLL